MWPERPWVCWRARGRPGHAPRCPARLDMPLAAACGPGTCPPLALAIGHSGTMSSPRRQGWACPGLLRPGMSMSLAALHNGAMPACHADLAPPAHAPHVMQPGTAGLGMSLVAPHRPGTCPPLALAVGHSGICPVLAARAGHVLALLWPGMSMSLAAPRSWACPRGAAAAERQKAGPVARDRPSCLLLRFPSGNAGAGAACRGSRRRGLPGAASRAARIQRGPC